MGKVQNNSSKKIFTMYSKSTVRFFGDAFRKYIKN